MKRNVGKLLAMTLTTVLLTSLIASMVAIPVAGANHSDTPDIEDGPGPWARAIDGTFYCYAKIGGQDYLLKSTDNGRSWPPTEYTAGTVVDIAVSSEDSDIVYVVDEDGDIYKTTDAGDNWHTLLPLHDSIPDAGNITSLAVGYIDDDPYVFAGTDSDGGTADGGVFVLDESQFTASWWNLELAEDHGLMATDVDVWEITPSPNFDDDRLVIAIFVDKTANKTFATTKYFGGQWAADMDDAELRYNAPGGPFSFEATSAVIWVPEDFDSQPGMWWMQYFVGVTATANGGDAYHVINSCAFDRDISRPNTNTNVAGLDGVGDVGHTSLLAGTDGGRIYRSAGYGIKWLKDRRPPAGDGNAYPILDDNFTRRGKAWAAVEGEGGAISLTFNGGKTWKQIFPR